jgi:hypothetical protein
MLKCRQDRAFKAVVNRCDLCDDAITCHEDLEAKIATLKEMDDSYESQYDKHEPMLLLCDFCHKKYGIPGYVMN